MSLPASRLRLLTVSLLVVSFLGALDHTIVSTSLATMAGSLGALEQMSWVVVSYTLAATVLLPVLGKLGDVAGPRRVFLASLVLFLLSSIACGFAQDMGQLVAGRVVQGMSSAGLQLMSQTIVALVTSPRQRPRLLSIVGAAFPIAILVGPVLGGAITDSFGWQWVFWINVPFCLVALALALVAIPDLPGGGRRRVDVAGAVVFSAAMVALVLAVTWIGHPDSALAALVAVVVAVAGFAVFFVIEVRAPEPILPLSLFRNRTVAAGIALSAIIGIGLFSVVSYIPTYIQMAYRTTATVSGLVPIATVFGMLVSNLVTGWLASRTGHYRVFAITGTSLATAGLLAMALLPIELPLWAPMAVMAVVGIGTGAFMSLVLAVVQSAAPRSETGAVTATTNLVRQVGATVGTAVIGGVLGAGLAAALPAFLDPSTLTPEVARQATFDVQLQISEVYRAVLGPVFAALAATYAVGIVAAVLLPAGRLSDEAPVTPAPQSQSV
jgi:EmrB/QacA subfamily drug resistance transporter